MSMEALPLRAHHICCLRFLKVTSEERGADYRQVSDKIKSTLLSQPESLVMVIEGVDELCRVCPQCSDGRCNSPRGDENEVRRWDAILLKELGLSFGVCLTSSQWQALIAQKAPFKLCKRCQWHKVCNVETSR